MKRFLLTLVASAAILGSSLMLPSSAEARHGWSSGYYGRPYASYSYGYRRPYSYGYRGYGYPGYYSYPRYSYGYRGYYPRTYSYSYPAYGYRSYGYPSYGYRSYYSGPSFYVGGRRGGFYW
jgi:hypothetical protein